jgi:hypothetical protein
MAARWRASTDERALPRAAVLEGPIRREAVLTWFDAERASLVAMAAATDHDMAALRLRAVEAEYFEWRRRFDNWIAAIVSQGCPASW